MRYKISSPRCLCFKDARTYPPSLNQFQIVLKSLNFSNEMEKEMQGFFFFERQFKIDIYEYEYFTCMSICKPCVFGTHSGQKRAWEHLKIEMLLSTVWELGIMPRSSEKATAEPSLLPEHMVFLLYRANYPSTKCICIIRGKFIPFRQKHWKLNAKNFLFCRPP